MCLYFLYVYVYVFGICLCVCHLFPCLCTCLAQVDKIVKDDDADVRFERKMGQMFLAQILYPFARALQVEGLTTALVPDMLCKQVYKTMKVTTL